MVAKTIQIIAAPEMPLDDLREMNEEQFIELFNYLKTRTHGFKEFSPDLILENNRYLLVLRLCLGLSQKEFGRQLGVTKDWVRHTEAGRNKILHFKPANRYVDKINSLLNQAQIGLERALENWRRYKFVRYQDFPEVEVTFKPLMKMNESEFKECFKLISKETEGFTSFPPNLLVRIPQSLLIFRIALGIDHRKFATLLRIDRRTLRKYEHLDMRIKPLTAAKFVKRIDALFRKTKVQFQDALQNLYRFKNVFQKRSLNSCIEQGLRLAQKLPPNELENKINDMLREVGIPFEIHARVKGLKRDYNVDFAIPGGQNPKIIMEVTEPTLLRGRRKNYRQHVCLLDHKFQMIKARHPPPLLTVLVLLPNGIPADMQRMEEMVQAEILNTDMYVIKENELGNLIAKVKEKCVEM